MRAKIEKQFNQVLSHLYINPLERCNLHCKICYTRKTAPILSESQILEFIKRYEAVRKLQTITFCGGEVFTLPYFTGLVNKLTSSECHPALDAGSPYDSGRTSFARMTKSGGIFVQIITNGTIDRLSEFKNPNMINLIVSLDGLEKYHDKNRGKGNFKKSIGFIKKASKLGFHIEIFSIVTRQNIDQIDDFEEYIYSNVILNEVKNPVGISEHDGDPSSRIAGLRMTGMHSIPVTYHPRKPPAYLLHHPQSNIFGETHGFDFLTDTEMIQIMQERLTFPPKELGCYQIALVSDGRIFGCCEGTIPIGKMSDDISYLFDKMEQRLELWVKENPFSHSGKSRKEGRIQNRFWTSQNDKSIKCLGCSQPDFVCGIKKQIKVILGSPDISRDDSRIMNYHENRLCLYNGKQKTYSLYRSHQ